MCPFLHLWYTALITVAIQEVLKSGRLIPHTPLFLKIVLASLVPLPPIYLGQSCLCLHKNSGILIVITLSLYVSLGKK